MYGIDSGNGYVYGEDETVLEDKRKDRDASDEEREEDGSAEEH